jgi:hypothetical protein
MVVGLQCYICLVIYWYGLEHRGETQFRVVNRSIALHNGPVRVGLQTRLRPDAG